MGSIELHVHGDPDAMGPAVRSALADIDPNLPPISMTSFPEMIRITTSERTLIARLSDAFGAARDLSFARKSGVRTSFLGSDRPALDDKRALRLVSENDLHVMNTAVVQ